MVNLNYRGLMRSSSPTGGQLDRFRGGLLGIGMVPTALAIASQNTAQGTTGDHPDNLTGELTGELRKAADFAMVQTKLFTSQPNPLQQLSFHRSLSKKGERFTLLAAIPGLMRYHDSWERRWQQAISNGRINDVAIVHTLLLGDLLEVVLCGYECDAYSFACLEDRLTRCDLSIEQRRYYRSSLASISARQLPQVDASAGALSPFYLEGVSEGAALIGGAIGALSYPESYRTAVYLSAQYGVIAPVIAGLLSGCAGGYSSLPVLWQLADRLSFDEARSRSDPKFNYSEMMRIADSLFAQWAGVQSE